MKKENLIFPIKLSTSKSAMVGPIFFWFFIMIVMFLERKHFIEQIPLFVFMDILAVLFTYITRKLILTEIYAEQDYFVVKSGKKLIGNFPYSSIQKVKHLSGKYGEEYKIYVEKKCVAHFSNDFTNWKEFVELLEANDVFIKDIGKRNKKNKR